MCVVAGGCGEENTGLDAAEAFNIFTFFYYCLELFFLLILCACRPHLDVRVEASGRRRPRPPPCVPVLNGCVIAGLLLVVEPR